MKTIKDKPINPLFPWMGGKSRLRKTILPLLPAHKCYVEPFAGGSAILLAKPRAISEVINDSDGELMNLYRVVQNHLDAFLDHFQWMVSSREHFERFKTAKLEQMTDIQRAVRYFYLQRHAFGGQSVKPSFGTATTSPAKLNLDTLVVSLQQVHERLNRVYIEQGNWQSVVERYDRPHTLFYCDPPYWKTAGYKTRFPWGEYRQLKSSMASARGMFILSINDHPDIRSLFRGFKVIEVETVYSPGKGRKPAKELLIFNQRAENALNKKTKLDQHLKAAAKSANA